MQPKQLQCKDAGHVKQSDIPIMANTASRNPVPKTFQSAHRIWIELHFLLPPLLTTRLGVGESQVDLRVSAGTLEGSGEGEGYAKKRQF